jgi:hypothetical protein
MDAINAASQPIQTGGGNVNCSKEIRSWERFYIGMYPSYMVSLLVTNNNRGDKAGSGTKVTSL